MAKLIDGVVDNYIREGEDYEDFYDDDNKKVSKKCLLNLLTARNSNKSVVFWLEPSPFEGTGYACPNRYVRAIVPADRAADKGYVESLIYDKNRRTHNIDINPDAGIQYEASASTWYYCSLSKTEIKEIESIMRSKTINL